MSAQTERDGPVGHADEVLRRNTEESRRLIEEKRHARRDPDVVEPEGTIPGDAVESRPPGQWDVPRCMTTGRGMGGGRPISGTSARASFPGRPRRRLLRPRPARTHRALH